MFAIGPQLKAANPLVQEQLPVESWGTNVLTLGFAGRTNGDTYRVLAAYSNTWVTNSGVVVTGYGYGATTNYEVVVTNLDAGKYYETVLEGPAQFQATKPIQVAHFANGGQFELTNEGDPCEILLPTINHYLTSYIVYAPTNADWNFNTNYMNVVVAQAGIGTTLLDGMSINASNFVPIGSSGYYGTQIPVLPGTHMVSNPQPIEVQVYGWGYYDAYGYSGGSSQ